jgi:hypothetical protein
VLPALASADQAVSTRCPGIYDIPSSPDPRHWSDIDQHYQALRLEMMILFADLGIADG